MISLQSFNSVCQYAKGIFLKGSGKGLMLFNKNLWCQCQLWFFICTLFCQIVTSSSTGYMLVDFQEKASQCPAS